MNNINVKTINTTIENLFTLWLNYLKPYHKLRDKEIEIISFIIYKRYRLSKKISDDKIIDKILISKELKEEIKEKFNYKDIQIVSNMLTTLRNKGVIKDNKIIKGLIPNITDDKNFKLIFNFVIDGQ